MSRLFRKKSNSFKNKSIRRLMVISLIIAIICFLSVGYSAHSVTNSIENIMASVKPRASVRVTGIAIQGAENSGASISEDYNVSEINGTINLPNANSTVTYKVDVTVFLGAEMMISNILDLDDRLDYEITDYALGDALCNSNGECNFGASTTFYVTIKYKEGSYSSINTIFPFRITFEFETCEHVAKIGQIYFDTLQKAINAVPNTNEETRVLLLTDRSEVISIKNGKNIILDLQGNVLSNNDNNPVIANYGKLFLTRGFVTTDAATNGAINNESTGEIVLNDINVDVTGGRQAFYNNKGRSTIQGNTVLKSVATERAAVQNVSGGTMNIISATIISTGSSGLNNAGTLTIGTNDGDISKTNPYIQGIVNGVLSTTNYSMYDGVVKGSSGAFDDVSKITNRPVGYGLVHSHETIGNFDYDVASLSLASKVTFNANGGNVTELNRYVETGKAIGSLPVATRANYELDGWYSAANGGTKIEESTIVDGDMTIFAHWIKSSNVAKVGDMLFDTVQAAVNYTSSGNNTIKLLKNVAENITVSDGKDIVIDFGNYTLSNNGNAAVITNSGIIRMISGTITSSANTGAINNNAGELYVSGGQIIATGSRQAIYIVGGVVTISDSAYLSSKTSGAPSTTRMERGTVQCLPGGTVIITGGTIVNTVQHAVTNEGVITIGTKDGNIDTLSPTIMGKGYGIKSAGTIKIYDGIIKGVTSPINGNVSELEDNSDIAYSTEIINGVTYQTANLE